LLALADGEGTADGAGSDATGEALAAAAAAEATAAETADADPLVKTSSEIDAVIFDQAGSAEGEAPAAAGAVRPEPGARATDVTTVVREDFSSAARNCCT
jgi:hypothetical protein